MFEFVRRPDKVINKVPVKFQWDIHRSFCCCAVYKLYNFRLFYIVGPCIATATIDSEINNAAILSLLIVKNGYRRLGIGSTLLKEVEHRMGNIYNYSKISLISLSKANSFYEKNGYTKIDDHRFEKIL
jgi:ribosomal protein S18 acetylase RimI-like enzyme